MAYSQDIRERVVRAVEEGKRSQRQIAEDYEVSLSFVEEVWRRYRETGQYALKVWRPGPVYRLAGQDDKVREVLTAHADATLEEMAEQIYQKTRCKVSQMTMSRTLRRLGITRKKRVLTRVNGTNRKSSKSARTFAHKRPPGRWNV